MKEINNLNVKFVMQPLEKNNLKKHVSTVFEQKKQFKSDICNTNFAQKGHFNIHFTTVHDEK